MASAIKPPDIIVSSYPTIDMSEAAIEYAAPRGIPVIIDVRDLWPDIFAAAFPKALQALRIDAALLAPLSRKKNRIFDAAAAIVATSRGYLAWAEGGREGRHISRGAVFHLAHPKPESAERSGSDSAVTRKELGIDVDATVVWFVGTFGKTYDLVPVISAARAFATAHGNVHFVFSGDGEMRAEWQELTTGLRNVTFTGWLGHDALVRVAAIADIGLLAYRSGAPQGLPNKLFDYMALGVPVISSLQGECRDFIESEGIGSSYSADVEHDLTRVMRDLVDNKEKRRAMGAAALRLFAEEFDADIVYNNFVDYIETVQGESARRMQG